MFRLLFLLFVYSIISLLGYFTIPAFAAEAPCTEIADTEPHPLRPAPARPCQKEPPKWNLSCGNDAKPSLELELPRTLDDTYNCSRADNIGRLACSRRIEKYPAPPVNFTVDLTDMALPVAGVASNTSVADSLDPSTKMTQYPSWYLQGDPEPPDESVLANETGAGGLIDKTKDTSILFLGDSITQGYYPCELDKILKSSGYNKINYVGTQNPYYCSNVKSEGYAGYTTEKMFTEKNNWLKTKADLAVIHLGTNDVAAGVTTETTIRNLRQIISDLKSKSPGIKILLSKIIPLNSGNLSVSSLNEAIGSLASETNSKLVDAGAGINLSDLTDGVHPNLNGGKTIAKNYFRALSGETGETAIKSACSLTNPLECLLNFSGPIAKLIPNQVLNHYKEQLIKAALSGKTYNQIFAYVKDNQILTRAQSNKLFQEDPNRQDIQSIRLSDMQNHINPPYSPGDIWYKLWLKMPATASNDPSQDQGHVDIPGEVFLTSCLKSGGQCQSDPTVSGAKVKITSGYESFKIFLPHLVEDNHRLEQFLHAALIDQTIPAINPQPEFPRLQANLNKADRDPEWTVAGDFRNNDGCVKTDSFSNPGDSLEAKQNKTQGLITGVYTFFKDIEYKYPVDTAESLGYIAACKRRLKLGEETSCPDPLPPTVKWNITAPIPIFIFYPLMNEIADQTVRSPGGIFQALYPEIPKTIGEIKDKPGKTTISYKCTSSVPCTGGTSDIYLPWWGTVYDLHQKLQAMFSPITNAVSGITNFLGNNSSSSFAGNDIQAAMAAAAARHNIPLKFLQTIYEIEGTEHMASGACVTSGADAKGPMQIVDGPGSAYWEVADETERKSLNLCNPGDAAELAARIIVYKAGSFSDSNRTAIRAAARGYYGSCDPDNITETRWGENVGYCDFVIYRMGLCSSLAPSCDGQ